MAHEEFREWLVGLRRRVTELKGDPEHRWPDTPMSVDAGDGKPIDTGSEAIALIALVLLTLLSGIILIFTTGAVFQAAGGLTVLAGIWWTVLVLRSRKPVAAWQREAQIWPGALVMANSGLFSPGKMDLPGAVVVSFVPVEESDPERLGACAEAIYALLEKSRSQLSSDEIELVEWLEISQQRQRYGRIRVPKSLAGDDSTWLLGMRFARRALPNGVIDRKVWPLLIRPDLNESAELLPYESLKFD